VALAATGCGGDAPLEPTPPPPNAAPTISSLTVSQPRVEVGDSVQLSATVSDPETPVQQLAFEWSANAAGTFDGTGAQVRWRPATTLVTPVAVEVRLTVVEQYTVPVGRSTETRENRTTSAVTVHANNSRDELANLALTFLADFGNSSNTPEFCVRNFTDQCRGKTAELNDIRVDRQRYVIASYSVRVDRIDIVGTTAYIFAPCTFNSIDRATGVPLKPSVGICALTALYEPYRWWLCTSNYCQGYSGCHPVPGISSFIRGLRGQ
jgi:hypothetical protein